MAIVEKIVAGLAVKGLTALVKNALAKDESYLGRAIVRTAEEFENAAQGLKTSLSVWVLTPEVQAAIESIRVGEIRIEDTPLIDSLRRFVYLPGAADVHEKLVEAFLNNTVDELFRSEQGVRLSSARSERLLHDVGRGVGEIRQDIISMSAIVQQIASDRDVGQTYVERCRQELSRGAEATARRLIKAFLATTAGPEDRSDALALLASIEVSADRVIDGAVLLEQSSATTQDLQKQRRRRALAAYYRGNGASALALADEAVASDPTDIDALLVWVQIGQESVPYDQLMERLLSVQTNSRVRLAMGQIALRCGRTEEAIEFVRSIPIAERPAGGAILLAETLFGQMVAKRPRMLVPMTAELERTAIEIDETLTPLLSIAADENPELRRAALALRAGSNAIAGKSEDALADFAAAAELSPTQPEFWRNYGFTLFAAGRRDEALSALERSIDAGIEARLVMPLVLHLSVARMTAAAVIERAREWHKKNPCKEAAVALAEYLCDAGELGEAEVVLADARRSAPDSAEVLVALAAARMKASRPQDAEEFLREAIGYAHDAPGSQFALIRLAQLCANHGKFGEAADLYDRIVAGAPFSPWGDEHLAALYQANRWSDAASRAREMRLVGRASITSLRVELAILEQTDRLPEAAEVCAAAQARFASQPDLLVATLRVMIRAGRLDEAEKRLAQAEALDAVGPETRMAIAEAYSMLQRHEPAMRHALQGLREGREDRDVCLAFLRVFHSVPHDSSILRHESVTTASRVTLRMVHGTEIVEIVPEDSSTVATEQYRPDSAVGRRLIGKKVGDVVGDWSRAGESAEIVEIKSVPVHEYQSVLAQYGVRFEGDTAVRVIRAEDALDEMRKTAGEITAYQQNAIDMYRGGKLTVGALASLFHRGLVDMWWGLLADPESSVHVATASVEEQTGAISLVDGDQPLVLEATAAFTLGALETLPLILGLGREIIVPQSSLDSIGVALGEKRPFSHSDGGMMSSIGGELRFVEFTKEQKERDIAILERLRSELLLFRVEGRSLDSPLRLEKDVGRALGKEAVAAIELAKERGGILVSDDLRLRQLAVNSWGVTGVWSLDLLDGLLRRRRMSDEAVEDARMRMLTMGMTFVPINGRTLAYAARKDGYVIGERLGHVLGVVSRTESERASSIRVLADFVRHVWLEPVPLVQRMGLLVRCLELARDKAGIAGVKALRSALRARFVLAPGQAAEIDQIAERWAPSTTDTVS